MIAFKIENEGSWRISQSQILPGLDISVLTEVLQRSRKTHHGEITAWLLQKFQN